MPSEAECCTAAPANSNAGKAAPYGGKLTRYLVDDGAHVSKGGDFCEVEVMKMLFNLKASEASILSLHTPNTLSDAAIVRS